MEIQGYIDSASLSGVALALAIDEVEKWPQWFQQSAIEVTSTLCADNQFRVVPGPGDYSGAYGLYDQLMLPLYRGNAVIDVPLQDKIKNWANDQTKNWLSQNSEKVKSAYYRNLNATQKESFEPWLEGCIAYFFVPHCKMQSALFNKLFLPEISQILNIPLDDLKRVWSLSGNPRTVADWVQKQPNSEDFKIAKEAFVLSALIRGRYHDTIAKHSKHQILHHPLRRNDILDETEPTSLFRPTNTEVFVTSFILANAFVEKRIENRVDLWGKKIVQVRELVRLKVLDLSGKPSNSIARDYVISAISRQKLSSFPGSVVSRFDFFASVLLTGSYYLLSRWLNLPLEGGLLAVPAAKEMIKKLADGKSIGEGVASTLYNSQIHVSNLVDAIPGRLESKLKIGK